MLQLLASLRADARSAELPAIAIDREYSESAAIELFKAGVDDYLDDSTSPPEFIARVRMVMRRAQRLDLSTAEELVASAVPFSRSTAIWDSKRCERTATGWCF